MSKGIAREPPTSQDKRYDKPSWPRRLLPFAILMAGLTAAYLMGWHEYVSFDFLADSREALKRLVASHPILAPLIFSILYALAVAIAFPAAWVLTVFGGFLFGWILSSVLVAFSATLGATALFLAARSAFGEGLRGRLGGRAERMAAGFEENAFAYLLVLRVAPVFPFFVVNIAPALFDVRPRTYIAATFIGILPGVIAYSWLGQGVESVIVAAEAAGREVGAADLVTPELTLGFVLIALVAALAAVVKSVRGRKNA